ncbi:MAG: UDP-galactopyranose mutase [Puniceicoccales bacterium]|jgi:UDP-galactopyranose mutase|nr:UDP-galactopyranose mutase [Puniceicoccales bacterium]
MVIFDNLVVGAGISGATIARISAERGERVLVIDRRSHIAGNCYDYVDENGICIHKYGSHIFHTNNEKVWNFLNRFTDFNTFTLRIVAVIDGIEAPIPFNIGTLYRVFPQSLAEKIERKLLEKFAYNEKIGIADFQKQDDDDLKFLAKYIYEKVFYGYNQKQWGRIPSDAVMARVPVYVSKDSRYFQDKYQGIPLRGYTKMIEKMLDHSNIVVRLCADYKEIKEKFGKIFHTGSIDEFFDYKFGQLPYRSVNFKLETHCREFYQSGAVVNYPCNYDFTRIHEYKYYLGDKSEKTVIAKEYSEPFESGKNERFYPIDEECNRVLYEKYIAEAKKNNSLRFLGRLGDYRYYDMDDAVERAIDLF